MLKLEDLLGADHFQKVRLHHLADRLGPEADVTLYVEGDNTAAVKTYRRLGFDVFSADIAYAGGSGAAVGVEHHA